MQAFVRPCARVINPSATCNSYALTPSQTYLKAIVTIQNWFHVSFWNIVFHSMNTYRIVHTDLDNTFFVNNILHWPRPIDNHVFCPIAIESQRYIRPYGLKDFVSACRKLLWCDTVSCENYFWKTTLKTLPIFAINWTSPLSRAACHIVTRISVSTNKTWNISHSVGHVTDQKQ